MAINQIKEVIISKGINYLRPNDDFLKHLGIKVHKWNKWINKKSDPEFHHVPDIANFLKCEISDLFPDIKAS